MSSTVYEARNEPAPRTFVGYAPIDSNFTDLVSDVLSAAWEATVEPEDAQPVYRFQVIAEFGTSENDHSATVLVWS